ncbi:hypothetical protein, conserved [Eimeria tenella]|uniref:BAP29/BAP31 transmembrane domain-containing protein n=1 Tax=Eimeria tenella TaxID=5802 RepID=U6L2I7_EIMTE|nr:hypothetical protein, conserved [Eimeria tenella]CDJ41965.1 hypothetical protein, conserved [Eimeria tenella]|eukprot:XP_013232715.1 hypothetical protein, conserved [Eimeria tenella]
MKDFAYFFLPFGGILAALLVFVPTRRVHRACVSLCCLHLQLGPLHIGIAASVCLYSSIRLFLTAMKLREVYAAAARPEAAAAALAGLPPAAAAAAGLKGGSSYQLRHERNLWIELFCLVLWLFVWRCGKLLGRQWQRIDALKAELLLLQQQQQQDRNERQAAAKLTGPETAKQREEEAAAKASSLKEDKAGGSIEMMRLRKTAGSAEAKED